MEPRPASRKFVLVSRLIYWSSVKPPLDSSATIIYDNNLYSINYLYCTITSPRIELQQRGGLFFQGKAIHSQSVSAERPRGGTQTRSGPAIVVVVIIVVVVVFSSCRPPYSNPKMTSLGKKKQNKNPHN